MTFFGLPSELLLLPEVAKQVEAGGQAPSSPIRVTAPPVSKVYMPRRMVPQLVQALMLHHAMSAQTPSSGGIDGQHD